MDVTPKPNTDFPENLKRNRGALAITLLSAVGAILFLFYFYASPGTDIGPEQPIPFSHQVHAGVKNIQCQFCHPYVDRSTFPGIPPVEKCLYCHKYIIVKHPWIQKEHQYFNTNTPTPWRKVNYIPEHVFFNHKRHIKKEIACQECHGKVENMDRLQERRHLMGFCITCHEEKKAPLDCWQACHN
jgi:hypothetical protein